MNAVSDESQHVADGSRYRFDDFNIKLPAQANGSLAERTSANDDSFRPIQMNTISRCFGQRRFLRVGISGQGKRVGIRDADTGKTMFA